MTSYNRSTPGDNLYPQYSNIQTLYVKKGVAITKGGIYTLDAASRLVRPTASGGVVSYINGLYQAMATIAAPADEDTDTVQVLTTRSRLLLKAGASGLGPGQYVNLSAAAAVVTNDTVTAATNATNSGFVGQIFQVEQVTSNGLPLKETSAAGDLISVDVLRG